MNIYKTKYPIQRVIEGFHVKITFFVVFCKTRLFLQCLSFANISRLQLKIKLIVLRYNSIVESNRRRQRQCQEWRWGMGVRRRTELIIENLIHTNFESSKSKFLKRHFFIFYFIFFVPAYCI